MYHTIFFLDINPSSDAISREILSGFLIMSPTVIAFFNQKQFVIGTTTFHVRLYADDTI